MLLNQELATNVNARFVPSATSVRFVALARLDLEALAYDSARKLRADPAPPPIQGPHEEARRLVDLRYGTDSQHALYLDAKLRGGTRSGPSCQADCDECHRVLALVRMQELCETRDEYGPILAWIMDPEFLD